VYQDDRGLPCYDQYPVRISVSAMLAMWEQVEMIKQFDVAGIRLCCVPLEHSAWEDPERRSYQEAEWQI
jgi:hypothetical protein